MSDALSVRLAAAVADEAEIAGIYEGGTAAGLDLAGADIAAVAGVKIK